MDHSSGAYSSRAEKSEIKVLANLVPGGISFWLPRSCLLAVSSHGRGGGAGSASGLSGVSLLVKTLIA